MSKILVVDDERSIRNTFKIFLSKEGHELFLAEDANATLQISCEQELDLIITDIIMPNMTGIDLLTTIKSKKPDVPIIIMTGEPTVDTAKEAVINDANDYLIKPVSKENLMKATKYALEKKKLIDEKAKLEIENTKYRENLENLVKTKTEALQKAINGTVETIVKILEHKDPYTVGHQRRVGAFSLAIAQKIRLSEVPSEILAKPGKLTEGEFCVIKEHVKNGYELTKDIELSLPIADLILQHHERMDGSGYPNCLKNNEIQLGARILAVAGVIEAMTAHRPYQPGFDIEIALDEIRSNTRNLYNKEVSRAAIELFKLDKYDFSNVKQSLLI